MSTMRLRRVNKEIILACKDNASSIDLIDNSPFHLKWSFPGPTDTPYEGGIFEVDIIIPESYPYHPADMKFITKVYHPNVSSASGAICLDIINDTWSPAFTLEAMLMSVQSLLSSPEPNNPQDVEIAEHYKTNRQSFEETARYWTRVYARGSDSQGEPPQIDEIAISGLEKAYVNQFEEFGFERSKVIEVLRRLNYRGANVKNISEDTVMEELFK